MKNIIFNFALLTSINSIGTKIYASDQKVFSDIDKEIFTVNGRIASPYKTEFVNSLSDAYFVIESDCIKPLLANAYDRIGPKTTMSCVEFMSTSWGPRMSKVINDFKCVDNLQKFIYYVTAASGDIREENPVKKVVDNTLIMIPENALFMLLQYTYGIKRDDKKAELLLSSDESKKISVKPLLMMVLNKYRSHEQQSAALEEQRPNAQEAKISKLPID